MWNMNDVVKITYQGNYVYDIEFDNGVTGNVDFHEYIDKGPVFHPLKEMEFIYRGRHNCLAEWR